MLWSGENCIQSRNLIITSSKMLYSWLILCSQGSNILTAIQGSSILHGFLGCRLVGINSTYVMVFATVATQKFLVRKSVYVPGMVAQRCIIVVWVVRWGKILGDLARRWVRNASLLNCWSGCISTSRVSRINIICIIFITRVWWYMVCWLSPILGARLQLRNANAQEPPAGKVGIGLPNGWFACVSFLQSLENIRASTGLMGDLEPETPKHGAVAIISANYSSLELGSFKASIAHLWRMASVCYLMYVQ